jgi:hypothetical protein
MVLPTALYTLEHIRGDNFSRVPQDAHTVAIVSHGNGGLRVRGFVTEEVARLLAAHPAFTALHAAERVP